LREEKIREDWWEGGREEGRVQQTVQYWDAAYNRRYAS
jgi:hypothetical protein